MSEDDATNQQNTRMKTLSSTTRYLLLVLMLMGLLMPSVHAGGVFQDFQGNATTVEQQKEAGKWTVVMIWASSCHVCNEEAGQYSVFHTEHANNDAKIIGLSIDGQEGKADAEAFIERNGVTYPNLIGDVHAVAEWYLVQTGEAFRATPTFVVFGPNGEVQAAQAGAVAPSKVERFIEQNS